MCRDLAYGLGWIGGTIDIVCQLLAPVALLTVVGVVLAMAVGACTVCG